MPTKESLELWVARRERTIIGNLTPRNREEWCREGTESSPLVVGVCDSDKERPKLSRFRALEEPAWLVESAGDLTSLEEIEELTPFPVVSDQDQHITRSEAAARLSFVEPESSLRLEEETSETLGECAPVCLR